jgi:hypothetical protein
MSVSRPMLARARPSLRAAAHSAGRSSWCTQGSSRFWWCVTRPSPDEKRSTRSAAAASWSASASPGAWPRRLNDSVTARSCGLRCGCTLRTSQRAYSGSACGVGAQDLQHARRRARRLDGGRHEAGRDAVVLGLGDGVRGAGGADAAEFLFHLVDVALAFGLDQDLDARLPQVVAAAVAVVDADAGLDVVEQLVPGQELAHHAVDDGRAAHAAAHLDPEAQFAGLVLEQLQADVVPAQRRAVFLGAVQGDLELARQEGEFRVQRAPLAQDLGERPRVGDLVGRDTGQFVGADVADGVAAGLDAVHVHAGQQVHHVGALVQRDPVELHVGAGGEVAVAGLEPGHDRRAAAAPALRPGPAACPARRAAGRRRAGRTRGRCATARATGRWRSRRTARRCAASGHSAGDTSRSAGAAAGNRRRSAGRRGCARAGLGTALRARARTPCRTRCTGT